MDCMACRILINKMEMKNKTHTTREGSGATMRTMEDIYIQQCKNTSQKTSRNENKNGLKGGEREEHPTLEEEL